MSIAPSMVFDSFTRTQKDSWGSSDSGHAWSNTNANYDVSTSGYGTIYVPAGADWRYAKLGVPNEQDYEVLAKVRWTTQGRTDHGPILRLDGNGRYYLGRLESWLDRISIVVWDGSTLNEIVADDDFPLAPNTDYWIRFNASNTSGQLSLKVWQAGAAEPASWSLTCPYWSGAAPGAGNAGYWTSGVDSSYTLFLDTYYVYNKNPDSEPNHPVTDTFNTRKVVRGWGETETNQLWRGHVADDPDLYNTTGASFSVDGIRAVKTGVTTTDLLGMVGPSVGGTLEVKAAFSTPETTDAYMAIGARGDFSASGGNISSYSGYIAQIVAGQNALRIYKRSGGTWTQLGGTFTLGFTVSANTTYWLKLAVSGSSTTQIQAKAWQDGSAEPGYQITVNDASSAITSGRAWVYLDQTSVSTGRTIWLNDFSATVTTTGNAVVVPAASLITVGETTLAFSSNYAGDSNNNAAVTVQYRLSGSDDAWTTFGGTITKDTVNQKWTFTITGLLPGSTYDVKQTFTDPDGVIGTNPLVQTKTTTRTGVTVGTLTLSATADTISVTAAYSDDAAGNSTAALAYRKQGDASWISAGSFTADRAHKTFTSSIAGLLNDTTYQVQVTFSDPVGVYGTNPIIGSVLTLGKSIELDTIVATPSDISAVITVLYQYDLNQNATCAVQYKSIRDSLWTTLNNASIVADRGNSRFRATLTALKPNLSYQVRVTVSDPDGVVTGTPDTLDAIFTTKGQVLELVKRTKRYLYKVYDDHGTYIGTWHDAPEPEFSMNENGGVTDLKVTLPRKTHQLDRDPTIEFMNRVDIWCVDYNSDGMGVNLIHDWDMELGSWTNETSGWATAVDEGPDASTAMKLTASDGLQHRVLSEVIPLETIVPLVVKFPARARGGKLHVDLAAYDDSDTLIAVSDDDVETVGPDWQVLRLEWLPPREATSVRVRVNNVGNGTYWFDKVTLLQKELLIYRGEIEDYSLTIKEEGESVDIQVLGPVAYLASDYIEFLQYAAVQPTRDANAKRPHKPPADPSQMLKDVIDLARAQNPRCFLYYTADSIQLTGLSQEYTFRDKQLQACFDAIRDLCPPSWSWYIGADGLVTLRGPDTIPTHKLRIGLEILRYQNEKSIKNVKNNILVRGRQDADASEPDGFGSIDYVAFDQASIDKYGKRTLYVRDPSIKNPTTAEIFGDGRLEENKNPEQSIVCYIPDEKDLVYTGGALRGYNIESFRPGDYVTVIDPLFGDDHTFWDRFYWDEGRWDTTDTKVFPEAVPIKTIQYQGTFAQIELSERQPSATGDYARLARWLAKQEANSSQTDDN